MSEFTEETIRMGVIGDPVRETERPEPVKVPAEPIKAPPEKVPA